MDTKDGRVPDGTGLSQAEPQEGLGPTGFDPSRGEILRRLSAIEAERNVRIILAVESGSRAWGFPSPDSDYDVRFIYARSLDAYLSLMPGRDVIECPLDEPYDVTGWEARKALNLILKSNAIVTEWLESPIVYRGSEHVRALTAFADEMLSIPRLRYHYYHLGRSVWDERLGRREQIVRKKYFYALRPAIVLRHLAMHNRRPPMDIERLIEEAELPATLGVLIDALIAEKRLSREMGKGARLDEIDSFIAAELDAAQPLLAKAPGPSTVEIEAGDQLFRAIVLSDSGRLPKGEAGTAECAASQSGPKGIAQPLPPPSTGSNP